MAKQIKRSSPPGAAFIKGSLDMCTLNYCFGRVIYGFDTIIVMSAVPVILTDSFLQIVPSHPAIVVKEMLPGF